MKLWIHSTRAQCFIDTKALLGIQQTDVHELGHGEAGVATNTLGEISGQLPELFG